MLGQSKTPHQAEIDSAAELVDFYRFNTYYMQQIYSQQPISGPGMWNYVEYRALEGFVFAVTPFNFTSIGGKPADQPGAHGKHRSLEAGLDRRLLRLLPDEALPGSWIPGWSHQLHPRLGREGRRPGDGSSEPRRNPLHRLDRSLSRHVGDLGRTSSTRPTPASWRPEARTVFVHPSASSSRRHRASPRRFQYQGEVLRGSRAYIPESLWHEFRTASSPRSRPSAWGRHRLLQLHGAVIDGALREHHRYIDYAKLPEAKI
jgi:1-pyrroline-5-carboxylate dehydrogenase